MVRVLGLVPYPTRCAPGQRYRIEQWAPLLADQGVQLTFFPFLRPQAMQVLYRSGRTLVKIYETLAAYGRRVGTLQRECARFDAAFVYREAALLGTAWLERIVARRMPLVFDFDDAIYLPTSAEANRPFGRLKSRTKTRDICRLARHVTVGNEELARFARRHAADVTVIPSTIDTDEYQLSPRAPNQKPIVGWTGSATTQPYLQALAPALRELRRRIDFELLVIGGDTVVEGVPSTCRPWSADSEAADLRSIDVGVMPLVDDDWARGKCGMKALQYMGLGIPPVVSPVGVNATIVRDGENGFHARTDTEWVQRLELLLRDANLRARIGVAARRTVEERYAARVQAPRMAEVLRSVAAAGRL
jgi:glycosyltransferase involved in cell wall biosynthesis